MYTMSCTKYDVTVSLYIADYDVLKTSKQCTCMHAHALYFQIDVAQLDQINL